MGNFSNAKAVTFFDVETTHLDPSKAAILQISITTDWDDGNSDTWTTKIKPKPVELEFASKEALKICGYNEEDWADAPSFEEVAPTIVKKLRYGPLVAHNIQFDVNQIESNLKRYGYQKDYSGEPKTYSLGYPLIDTCALAYMFLPTERQNLDTLREHFNLSKDNAHDAEQDVKDCRTIFYTIVNQTINKLKV